MKDLEVICDISFKPIVTEEEACTFLGVSRSFLHNLRASGKIGFCREKGKTKKLLGIRYRREHLLDYIHANYDEIKPLKLKYQ
jgi:hypothetical protein